MSPPLPHRLLPVLGLLVLSPVAAEYLVGYDEGIGRPLQMLAGLALLVPLYGTAAVLVRELTRRAGKGWPTMLLLAVAFGVVQAGLADQTLFHLEFAEDDPDWATQQPPTTVPWLGIDARNTVDFVAGHAIWSFCAPIAVVEACAPRQADRPWLGRAGLGVVTALYLAAVTFFFFAVGAGGATAVELVGTAGVVLALGALAFALPRRTSGLPGRVPPPWTVGVVGVAVFAAQQFLPHSWTWLGVALTVVAFCGFGALLLLWSRRTSWTRTHVLAAAGSTLLVRVGSSFLVEPLGNPSYVLKYASNTVLTLGVLALLAWAWRRQRSADRPGVG